MNKHTKGPWQIDKDMEAVVHKLHVAGALQITPIAKVYKQQDEALICAAPELLEAAAAYLASISRECALTREQLKLQRELAAAINKAKGVPNE